MHLLISISFYLENQLFSSLRSNINPEQYFKLEMNKQVSLKCLKMFYIYILKRRWLFFSSPNQWYDIIKALNKWFFSSPELKAQVSFSDHLSSVVRLSVCLSVNLSHFHLLLQNHWANFNQTWHKVSFGEGDSSLFKWRATRFPKGR